MPTTIEGIPVFTFLSTIGFQNKSGASLTSSQRHVGSIVTLNDYKGLVPKPNTHVEIEQGIEALPEVRVVNSLSGDYHSSTGENVVRLIKTIQDETAALYRESAQRSGELFPGMSDFQEHEDQLWHCLIIFDDQGQRVLPMLSAGTELIATEEEFWMRESLAHCEAFVTEDFAGIGNRRTGQIDFVSDRIKDAVIREYNCKQALLFSDAGNSHVGIA